MTLTCPGRYTDVDGMREIPCQWRHNPDGIHHAHDSARCIMWVAGDAAAINTASACPEPPLHEVHAQAAELAAKVKAGREANDAPAAQSGLGLYPPYEHLIDDTYTPNWRTIGTAEERLGFIDPNLTVAVQDLWAQNAARGTEIERLRARDTSLRNLLDQDTNDTWPNELRPSDLVDQLLAENARLRARITAMAEAWKRDLPDTIRTAVAAEALLATLEG